MSTYISFLNYLKYAEMFFRGSSLNHLAILHPMLVAIYSLVVKEGVADHGIKQIEESKVLLLK